MTEIALHTRVRAFHRGQWVGGSVWAQAPKDSYWVIPDDPQQGMVQGCICVPAALTHIDAGETLF